MGEPYPLGLGFGQPAPTPSGIEHGQDIETPAGTDIYASARGTAYVHVDSVLGRYVVVDLGNGLQYVFAHLRGFAVRNGQRVDASTLIGYSGGARTDPLRGDATGPHLWFGVRKHGTFVNPTPYLNQAKIFGDTAKAKLNADAASAYMATPPLDTGPNLNPAHLAGDALSGALGAVLGPLGKGLIHFSASAVFVLLAIALIVLGIHYLFRPEISKVREHAAPLAEGAVA